MANTTTVVSRGIYHGLPVYPESVQGLTAIVTGSNGISGLHMLKVLSQSPKIWKKIYCLSRRPPAVAGALPSNAEFISVDFLDDPSKIAEALKSHNVTADALFFYSYIQVPPSAPGEALWSNVDEMVRSVAIRQSTSHKLIFEPALLLSNLLEALPLANVKPKKIMLQTGAKNYGVHLGPTRLPQRETDPRVELEPNFYYPQEDVVHEWCEAPLDLGQWQADSKDDVSLGKRNQAQYTIGMPCAILGAVPDAAMNLAYPLALYATIQAHLKEPLRFPGGLRSWQNPQDQSSAMLNGYLEEWSVLREQKEIGEKYNAVDGSAFTWEAFWPRLAAWYGLEWKGPETQDLKSFATPYDPPPRGYGSAAQIEYSFTFCEWAKRPEVHQAWNELVAQHKLGAANPFKDSDRIFGFLDGMMLLTYPFYFSTTKARKQGWFGFVDSEEVFLEVFNDFHDLGMLPRVPMVGGKF